MQSLPTVTARSLYSGIIHLLLFSAVQIFEILDRTE